MSTTNVRIGDVLELERRPVEVNPASEYKEIGVRSFGQGIFHKDPVTGSELGNKRVFYIQPGDLVFSNVFAWEGAVALAGEKESGRIGSHRFMTYNVNKQLADPVYLSYFFCSDPGLTAIRNASPGSAGRNRTLGIKSFAAQNVTLPELDEQRRIAAKLDVMATSLSDTSAFDSKARNVIQNMRRSIFSKIYSVAQTAEKPIGDFADVVRGRGPRYSSAGTASALNQACVRWDGVDVTRARAVEEAWEATVPDQYRAQNMDVLVNSTGDGTIGRSCVVESNGVGVPFDSHVLAVRTNREVAYPEFIALMMQTSEIQDLINSTKGASTTKQTELGKKKLERIRLPIPTSLNDQKRILKESDALLKKLDSVQFLVGARQEHLKALRSSLLNAAFSGKL